MRVLSLSCTWLVLLSSFSFSSVAARPFPQYGPLYSLYLYNSFWQWPTWTQPESWNIWKLIQDAPQKAAAAADDFMERTAIKYHDMDGKISDFRAKVTETKQLTQDVITQFKNSGISIEGIADDLSQEAMKVIEKMEDEFRVPLPDEISERAKYRANITEYILDQMEEAFVRVSVRRGSPEENARELFEGIRPPITNVVLVAGNIIDNHGDLIIPIVITVAFMLVNPELVILRPILSILGFGPTGPIKGSVAAALQQRFWGAVVTKGSWFAELQRAGMIGGMTLSRFLQAIGKLLWG